MTTTFKQVDNETYMLSGSLRIDSISSVLMAASALLQEASVQLKIDLSEVIDSDSSGLALLIHLMREAKKLKKRVLFLNVPKKMQDIGRVSGLDIVLDLA